MALAVLRFDDELEFRRALHRQIARLSTLEDPVHITGGAPKRIEEGGSVCKQPTPLGEEWYEETDRRKPVLYRDLGDARGGTEDHRRTEHKQPARALAHGVGERSRDLVQTLDREPLEHQSGALGGHFGRAKLRLVRSRVPEDRDPGKVRLHLFEQLKLLAAQLGHIEEESRDIAAGAGQGSHPSLRHRIRLEIHSDDRNGLGRFDRGLHRIRVGGEDDIDACRDEPGGDVGVLLDLILVRGWTSMARLSPTT